MTREQLTVIPSARRLMVSLRDIGYDPASAVADLVDNSIDAGASRVEVTVHHAGDRSWIRIADDGTGMTRAQLEEAMRYGASREYGDRDLGNFGLGLKTASLSQCRRLTVASRRGGRGRVEVLRWDLDAVSDLDAWALERLAPSEAPAAATGPLSSRGGTVVLWERLDRIAGYARPDGAHARRAVEDLGAQIRAHLAMIFHRFLAGEAAGRRRIAITINGEPVRAWDPFARSEPLTRRLPRQTLQFTYGDVMHSVAVRPYVLPAQIQFSTPDAHAAAAGPARWNRQQGLYIYRRDRLVQSGGWCRLRTLDEHSKLARIAIHLPLGADDAFQINVSKARVVIPDTLRPALRTLISGVANAAQDAYRQRVRVLPGRHDSLDGRIEQGRGEPLASVWNIGEQWALISQVVERELEEHPELRDRVLLALANAGPATAVRAADAPAAR